MLSKSTKLRLAALGALALAAGQAVPAAAGGGAPFQPLIPVRMQMSASMTPAAGSGVVRIKSALSVEEAVAAIQKDVAAKGIRFFQDIDQSGLASEAGFYR